MKWKKERKKNDTKYKWIRERNSAIDGNDSADDDEADQPFRMETIARPINLPRNYTRNSR